MNTVIEANVQKPASPLSVRNFRLMWIGEGISLLGDQFYLIALPWLVLQLNGGAFTLGIIAGLASIPRALFMLVGGAVVDRFSPRMVMAASNFARMVLVALLSALVLTNTVRIEMLYVFALAFGLADAFYFPAQTSLVPQLLPADQLQAGNTYIQGTAQLSLFLGPVLAGALIALLGHAAIANNNSTPDLQGIGIAFVVDTLSFVASLLSLAVMRISTPSRQTRKQQNVLASIWEGFMYVWSRPVLRMFFLLIVALNFLVLGPVTVGIPVLADTRLMEGAAAFGIIMSAFGAGSLLGIVLSGVLPAPKPEHTGTILLLINAFLGIGILLMALFSSTVVIAVIAFLIGATNGYVKIVLMTWLQKRIPRDLMGRVMSLLFFCSIGLAPISNVLAGLILGINLNVLFIGSGLLMAGLCLFAILLPESRHIGLETASNQAE